MKIEELCLSARAYNCLRRARIDTVEQLQQLSDDDLFRIRNMGTRTVEEIREKVSYIKTTTIGDTIRSMSDEELAKFLLTPADLCRKCDPGVFCTGYPHHTDTRCINAAIKYLKQPVEEPRIPSGFFLDKEESGLTEEV